MDILSFVLMGYGVVGIVFSIYLRFSVKSPIQKLAKEGALALSIQDILNTVFIYFATLHLMIVLVGVNFLLSK